MNNEICQNYSWRNIIHRGTRAEINITGLKNYYFSFNYDIALDFGRSHCYHNTFSLWFLGIWKLFFWRAALCFPYPKEVSEIMQNPAHFPFRYNLLIVYTLLRPSENMLIRANTDGTYSANWTPGAVGLYTIHVTIDGIEIGMSV